MICIPKTAHTGRLQRAATRLFGLLAVSLVGGALAAPAQAASFAVTYTDSAGEGFFDSSLGAARRTAFEASLSYWSQKLGPSPVTINIAAAFDNLGGTSGSAVLGQAGTAGVFRDFTSSNPEFKSGTFYGSALANHLAGRDLDPATPEIRATFNSDVDGPTVLGPQSFYYGLDSNPPTNSGGGKDSDFFSVALHEVGHGLNFFSLIGSSGAYSNPPYPGVYDTYLTQGNTASRARLTALSNAGRASAIISNNLYFDGPRTQSANGATPAKMFAPNPYQGGSSVSHLDETFYSGLNPNNLLTPVYSGPYHDAGPVGLAIFDDMGWSVDALPAVSSIVRLDLSPTSSRSVRFAVNFNASMTGVDSSDFALETSGISGASITGVSGSNTNYIVTVGGYSGSGTLKLNLVDNDSIADTTSGIKLGGTGVGNGNFSAGEVYTLTAPTTSGVSDLFSVNGNSEPILRTTAPSTTPVEFARHDPANLPDAFSFGITRAADGTFYTTTDYGYIVRIPATGGSGTAYAPATDIINFPFDIVLGPDGLLYVSDLDTTASDGINSNQIVKVNPATGAQTLLLGGGVLNSPRGLTFGSDGALYCSNAGSGVILRIDRNSGAQTTYATISGSAPEGIAFGPDGTLYVCDNPNGRIVKITASGVQSNLVASGGISAPRGMSFGADGFIYVAAVGSNTLVKIDPTSGAVTTVATGGGLNQPSDVFAVAAAPALISLNAGPSLTEGNSGTTLANFTLTRSGNASVASSVTVATANGTATAGSDYVAIAPTTVTFAAGDNAPKTISVIVNGDTTQEPDETFTLNLSSPVSATLGTAVATATILNDDAANTAPTFSGAPYTFVFTQGRAIQGVKVAATDADGDTFSFALSGGALPAGVIFNSDGSFSGTPTALSSAITRTVTVTDSRGASATAQVTLSVSSSKDAIISEFRFHGKNGTTDEYVELLNKTGAPLDLTGWSIQTRTAAGLQTTLIPANKILPSFGHLLFTGSGYSLGGYASSDVAIAGDVIDNSGVALLDAGGAVQDAVGFAASDAALREGAGLPNYPTANGEYTFMRDFIVSQSKNTDDSTNDFVFVSTTGVSVTGLPTNVPAQLGAPSPEGLTSPNYFNNQTISTLLDPSVASGVAPNRARITGGGTLGTLIVRRTIKNNTNVPITRLRLSVTSITSLNSAGFANAAQADVRLVSGGGETGVLLANGTTMVNTEGTTLEAGTGQPQQPLGGGLGSSINFPSVTLGAPLMPGQSRNYNFRLQIERGGSYFIALNILALTQ